MTVFEEPSGGAVSLQLVDWFWRRAVTADLDDASVVFLNTRCRAMGGHCASWLRIPRVLVAYTGEESVAAVTSAVELAIKDVCPRELTALPLAKSRLAIQDGVAAWVPTESGGRVEDAAAAGARRAARAQRAEAAGERAAKKQCVRAEAQAAKRRRR